MDPTNKSTATSALTLGVLTTLGGLIGYARSGYIPSIGAGFSVGAVYILSYLRMRAGESFGEEIGLLASTVLGGAAIPRSIKTGGKIVPVGLSVLGAYGFVLFGLAVHKKRSL